MNTFASLFTGFGGADIGATEAGFTPIWGVEFDPAIAAVAAWNGIPAHIADVRHVNYAEMISPDLLHASPVCKNASIAKQDGGEAAEDVETAEAVIRAIRALRPRAFTLENVRGYREFQSFKNILAALHADGYAVSVDVLNSADYGVPQTRAAAGRVGRYDPAEAQKKLAEFNDYLHDNHRVYEMFETAALDRLAAGESRVGAKEIFENMRGRVGSTGGAYDLDNTWAPWFARKAIIAHPGLKAVLEG